MIEFGQINGKKVYKITISNAKISADIINYGASLTALKIKSESGKIVDVVLGYDTLDEYIRDTSSFGRTIGRVSNRVKDAQFTLNGIKYSLEKNDGENSLHGGFLGFGNRVWDIEEIDTNKITLSYLSVDGEEGYPGNLTVKATYLITEQNGLKIEYYAICDQDTVVSLTNHSYFNLNGHGSGDVLSHELTINSNLITPVDNSLCTYNKFMNVDNTPFDFTKPKLIGQDIDKDDNLIKICSGYDVNYVFNGNLSKPIVSVIGDKTGLKMDVYSDQKGMHVYTANFLSCRAGKGKIYDKRHGVCFETQSLPNAINCSEFPTPILKKGETYKNTTEYRFNV